MSEFNKFPKIKERPQRVSDKEAEEMATAARQKWNREQAKLRHPATAVKQEEEDDVLTLFD